ncbi:hypothetical protein JK358_26500 [Nocardia sp. 2]|uniref:Integral membrane protein n=1 Tax=Nocardia acididurans TaxID=2802282 RepID=A0ABS1MCI1_9NOCA|nr:hypothetical protein [Nocardia acididurans]MBL1077959.1 hypothetical protein [Nocardia acididurans]
MTSYPGPDSSPNPYGPGQPPGAPGHPGAQGGLPNPGYPGAHGGPSHPGYPGAHGGPSHPGYPGAHGGPSHPGYPGAHGGPSHPGYPGAQGDPPHPGYPGAQGGPAAGSGTAAGRVAGALLAVAAVLTFVGSLVTLRSQTLSLGSEFNITTRWTAWRVIFDDAEGQHESSSQLVGVPLTLAAIAALAAAVLLLAGVGRGGRAVPALGHLAAGLTAGVTVAVIVSLIPPSDDIFGAEYAYGVGFWLLILAGVAAVGALVIGFVAARPGIAAAPVKRTNDVIAAILLLLAAIPALIGSFLNLTSSESFKVTTWGVDLSSDLDSQHIAAYQGVALVLGTVLAAVAATLLLAGLGPRLRMARPFAIASAALLFGAVLTIVMSTTGDVTAEESSDASDFGAGYWLLVFVVLLAIAAILATLIANAAPSQQPAYPPGFAPGPQPGWGPTPQSPAQQPFSPQQPLPGQPQAYPGQPQQYPGQPQQYPGQPAQPYPPQQSYPPQPQQLPDWQQVGNPEPPPPDNLSR